MCNYRNKKASGQQSKVSRVSSPFNLDLWTTFSSQLQARRVSPSFLSQMHFLKTIKTEVLKPDCNFVSITAKDRVTEITLARRNEEEPKNILLCLLTWIAAHKGFFETFYVDRGLRSYCVGSALWSSLGKLVKTIQTHWLISWSASSPPLSLLGTGRSLARSMF